MNFMPWPELKPAIYGILYTARDGLPREFVSDLFW